MKDNNGSNKEFQRTQVRRRPEATKQRNVGGVTVAIERSIVEIGHSVAKSVGSWRKQEEWIRMVNDDEAWHNDA